MESTSNKSRTPSRCREWERKRRNKFNEAVSKLGEIVKEITKTDNTSKEPENIQYPKIEIIQKAILCLTNFVQERTQLKAEILALQVELGTIKNKVGKDASTQVFLSIGKRKQSNKFIKQKSKRNALKEKQILTSNHEVETISLKKETVKLLPKLLPRAIKCSDKRSPENTLVVLPAAPYIFPQRPLLIPTVPPAIVLVDSNLQNINKFSSPVVNRNNGDITKTTMVNILPISAYSRPLSATKSKKNIAKSKKENNKKNIKPSKSIEKVNEPRQSEKLTNNKSKDVTDSDHMKKSLNKIPNNNSNSAIKANNNHEKAKLAELTTKELNKTSISISKETSDTVKKNTNITGNNEEPSSQSNEIDKIKEKDKETNNCPKHKSDDTLHAKSTLTPSPSEVEKPSNNILNNENTEELTKISSEKIALSVDKEKENKLPNILETTLCDTVVDGGNARLELAEEFLAASPTAAFLMSFPLVSGNRADSPADEPHNTVQTSNKDSNHRRNDLSSQPTQYFNKIVTNDPKPKPSTKLETSSTIQSKPSEPLKYTENNLLTRHAENKSITVTTTSNISSDNPFLNLPMPSLISTSCTISDTTFGLDFDCNIGKSIQNQSTSYASNNNFFYKGDPFNSVKNTIYSTSNISSSHDFNNLALYPCAMEKYSSKTKCDYANMDENLMKIGSSRLTYDIDLGWSHKSFDFVNPTTASNSFNKDNILNSVSAPYSSSYNPFNPDFHMPLVSSTTKKDNVSNKTNTSFADTITSFYSQSTNLWSEDVPFYTNNNTTKTTTAKHQSCINVEPLQTNNNTKPNNKHYETNTKETSDTTTVNVMKSSNIPVEPHITDKYTKKSPSKMHINWMTSEIRHMESNCNTVPIELKDNSHKSTYPQLNHTVKKQDHNESYFPISMHNFTSQPPQEEFQMWPSTRTVGPTEITMEPPPLNLPTLVGDLALGPHDKKKNAEISNRPLTQSQDIQNCGNFLSVTQLMNRSTDIMPTRYQVPTTEPPKTGGTKPISNYCASDSSRKAMSSRMDSQLSQPCYGFNESKPLATYDSMNQFSHTKSKPNKSDKSSKSHKNSYSAEALIRGGGCTQKIPENSSTKFAMMSQKFNDFNGTQDSSVAQVSHFPPILDYSDNSYATQQFSGTTLYNTTTNTISNSFYSNFMPASSNLMSSNYTSAPFSGEFMDYNNQSECNYTNHKYEELKMRNNPTVFPQDKVPSNYKSSRRESATKHKLECTKKDSSKKYQSKRAKLNNEVDEWNDPSHLLWQNKAVNKRHTNLVSEELPLPNYVGNQMSAQYQPDFFNSHLMPSNVQTVGHNVDRSLSFPVTSRANFNLSTIFPEITMKVQ
ncbi:hypothetical protein evm_012157 [Chilo suppressalis]|nr:hypothetical protein evm_012157 [Chilo suppressalis]